ncbi:MAG: M43 family zinc metalloprotease [Bacteroidota bacterium]|nr:M43 family zinc metalloprotease [Bacteroidota bacterium]
MKQKFKLLAAALFAGSILFAQDVAVGPDGFKHCGTDVQMQKVFAEHPELKAEYEAREVALAAQDKIDFRNGYGAAERNGGNPSAQTGGPPQYIIPIVFHIIHDYGSENISDAQVIDAVRILNEDFRKNNADTTLIVPGFVGISSDAKIEFRLANIDPNGNCTNGIDRFASVETYVGDDGSKLNYWPRNKYLNVWVVKNITSGAAGYAYLPGTAPSAATDGIIILSTYVGSIGSGNTSTSRALTHEVGHFLNLRHVWGNTNNPGIACGDDAVSDTPDTEGWTTCNLTNNDVCNPGTDENVQNFMEYSYCTRMYTTGQKTRMQAALNASSGQRNSLPTASNLTATGVNNSPPNVCAPISQFNPVDKIFCCVGASVTFTSAAYNGQPNSWNWSFPGGTPATSTDSVPVIQYNTPGIYAVTLTVSNSAGSNTLTRTGHVRVSSTTATYSNWQYVEGIENATTFSADYTIINPQGNGWTRVTTAAATGSASVKLTNTSSMGGTSDEFVTPTIDMTAITNPVFTFKVAQRQRTSTTTDRLRVYTSINCGQTWIQRFSKVGTALATGAVTTSSTWVPASSEWRTETVNLSAVVNSPNLRIKFTFESDGGNSIYIDDINIVGVNGIDAPDAGIQHFEVYPNPIQDNSLVSFSLDESQHIALQLFDMSGRLVMDMYNGELSAGVHQFPVQTAEKLSSGLYFVRLTTAEGRMVTQKLIAQ